MDAIDRRLGQMVLVGFRGAEPDECRSFLDSLRECPIAGVWLTDKDSPLGITFGNVRSPEQVRRLTGELQRASEVPLLVAIDGEGGEVIRLKPQHGFPEFPSPQAIGERNDLAYTRAQTERLVRTLVDCGINLNVAPVLDVNKNPANPVIGSRGRSFSSDAEAVARHAIEFVEAHHRAGIGCVGKHFPGHGSSTTDSHKGVVDVTSTWGEDELIPYRRLIDAGQLDAVLTAHVCLRQIDTEFPATLSEKTITGLLRQQLGFDGPVITDDLNMGAIQAHYPLERAIELSVRAGADIILHANLVPYDACIAQRTIAILRGLLEAGKLSEARVETSHQRVMALKRRLGML